MAWHTDPPRVLRPLLRLLDPWLPKDPDVRFRFRVWVFRVVALTNIALGLYYFSFRYTRSLNLNALWFAIPLLLAETYSFIGALLFILTLWKPAIRKPPPPLENAVVDVFITTYNEPLEVLRKTVEAALRIRYPHTTYVLDDGKRPEVRAMCEELGAVYITRGPEWEGRPRHAKAGNVNNALMYTSGEFVLFLDADQIPHPAILDRVLGYFRDPDVAFVQTPQYFYNVPPEDPFAVQAPLFYGPIQQGKDGWNAAFFCGTNAVVRREALFQLGVLRYVQQIERRILEALSRTALELRIGRRRIPRRYRKYAQRITRATHEALYALRQRKPIGEILARFHAEVDTIRRELVMEDLKRIAQDLAEIEAMEELLTEPLWDEEVLLNMVTRWMAPDGTAVKVFSVDTVQDVRKAIETGLNLLAVDLAGIAAPPPEALGLDEEVAKLMELDTGEALDVQPVDVLTITEDMATALQLHALGWKSVFHSEILAYGLGPEDLGSALQQRFRWAVGTIQVFRYYNPLTMPGLTWGQRLQYFMTIYSYFSGFASLIYLISPVIYLLTGIAPVVSFAGEFLIRIVPYLLVNWLMFQVASWGMKTFRGEQYSLALFPIWIQAVLSVLSGERITFKVTPKVRQEGVYVRLVWPQLTILVLQALAAVYAVIALALGWRHDTVGVVINLFWEAYDFLMLYVIVWAAVYRYDEKFRQIPSDILQALQSLSTSPSRT